MSGSLDSLSAALADRYRIERELGQGGMATVYLAEDLRHHRQVAVKVLKPELAAVIGAERFLREIQTVAALQHPHILALFDSGVAEVERSRGQGVEPSTASTSSTASSPSSLVYYVMPFVEGESLRDRLTREKQLPIADAVRIASEVASALDYAHRHGVIHRDIKPENILLHDGSALVADFGIALAVSNTAGHRMTETGMSLGTPHYMSPEQAMGEREIGPRSDMYALGCVTYEMLTGDPPFTASTAQAIVAKVMTEKPVPPSRMRDRVPEAVEEAVLTALEKLPADRFASAAEFAAALEHAPAGRGRHSGEDRGEPQIRRAHRIAVTASAVAAACAIVAVAALSAWRHASLTIPRTGVTRFSVPIPQPSDNTVYGMDIAIAPDGRTLAYLDHNIPGKGGICLRRLDSDNAELVAGTTGAQALVFSPDGASLAFSTEDAELRVLPIGGGASVPIAQGVALAERIDWGSDGFLYFVSGDSGVVSRVRATGGESEPIAPLENSRLAIGFRQHRSPKVLPDGKAVLFSVERGAGQDGDIFIANLQTRKTRLLLHGMAPVAVMQDRLYFIDMKGTLDAIPFDERTLSVHGQIQPLLTGVWSAEGKTEVALGGGNLIYIPSVPLTSQLVWVTPEGTEQPLGGPLDMPVGAVSISPAGDRIALSSATAEQEGKAAIWLYDIENQTLSRFTDKANLNFRPRWSPDGASIIFSSDRGSSSGARSLWIEPVDRRDTAHLLVRTPRHAQEVSWVAGSPWLVYREGYDDLNTLRDLRYMRPGTDTATHAFLATKADELNPALSPNGRWLAYTSNESGQGEVYVSAFPGPGPRTSVSSGGGTGPLWSRDGRTLYYRALDGRFMAVDVASGDGFSMSHRRALFSAAPYMSYWTHPAYDIAPDGRHFLFIKPPSRPELHVVLHWADEQAHRPESEQ